MTKRERAAALKTNIEQMLFTFRNAYANRKKGRSLPELLIQFDITAAGSTDLVPIAVEGHRKVLLSASDAFDKGVKYCVAEQEMRRCLTSIADEIINHQNTRIDSQA